MLNIGFRLAINDYHELCKMSFMIIDEGFSYCDSEWTYKIENSANSQLKSYLKIVNYQSYDIQIDLIIKTKITKNNLTNHIKRYMVEL